MVKKRSVLLFSVVLVLSLGLTGEPQAGQYGQYDWEIPPGLDLTKEQFDKIQDIRLGFQKEIVPLRMRWQQASLEVDRLSRSGADSKLIDEQMKELNEADAELGKKFTECGDQIRTVLTEQQRLVFDRWRGTGYGRGYGFGPLPGYGPGLGYGRGYGVAPGRGLGPGYGAGWRGAPAPGYGRGWGASRGGGWGRGAGKGYFCPYYRWRR